MNRAQSAILPGVFLGILVVVLVGVLVSSQMVLPSNLLEAQVVRAEAPTPVAAEAQPEAAPVEAAAAAPVDPGCQISSTFPPEIQQWCGVITKYAVEHNVDPNLVASVMLQESAGNPVAYSKSGAVGLLQVMPRDGLAAKFQCINGPCFSDRPTIQELENPEFNVAYGVRMLAELINKYGDVREALKYYGPKDVGYYYADIILTIFQSNQ